MEKKEIKKVSFINDEFDVGLFFYVVLKKNLLYLLLFFILSIAVAFFIVRYKQPIYEGSTIVQLRSKNQASDLFKTKDIYDIS